MFGANFFGKTYFGQSFFPIGPVAPPPSLPEFEEQLGVLVRHICGARQMEADTETICDAAFPELEVINRCTPGSLPALVNSRCLPEPLNAITSVVTRQAPRWPTVSIRK